jgi:hypothetical protein
MIFEIMIYTGKQDLSLSNENSFLEPVIERFMQKKTFGKIERFLSQVFYVTNYMHLHFLQKKHIT